MTYHAVLCPVLPAICSQLTPNFTCTGLEVVCGWLSGHIFWERMTGLRGQGSQQPCKRDKLLIQSDALQIHELKM